MLAFFRRYQRFIYLAVTVVIVISFSFFGTYAGMGRADVHKREEGFVAVDGTEVSGQELADMIRFLQTDNEDKLLLGGEWGPNFLNDGVIKRDFLQSGIGALLIAQFKEELGEELELRHRRERHYAPYVHPRAPFVAAKTVWDYLAPGIGEALSALQGAKEATSPEAVGARISLFLQERRFPAPLLYRMLRQQEQQYSWLPHDPALDRTDLALFGYHTAADWFGPRFLEIAAKTVINGAIVARQEGYLASEAEALEALVANGEVSFHQQEGNPKRGVASSRHYVDEQLRRMGMDRNRAAKVWQQVLLYRRLLDGVGGGIFVDPLVAEQYAQFAYETVIGKRYRLPESLRFSDYRALQKFQIYLQQVSNVSQRDLLLPESFLSVAVVKERAPELVQRRFVLDLAMVNREALEAEIGVRETWDWELQANNWKRVKEAFPQLALQPGESPEERQKALNEIDRKSRFQVDCFARSAILEERPELLEEALKAAAAEKKQVGLSFKGQHPDFPGVESLKTLINLLDAAWEKKEPIVSYTPDQVHYYRIAVLEQEEEPTLLAFDEADQAGVLDALLDRRLEEHYEMLRKLRPSDWETSDGAPKPFIAVKREVADDYFAELFEAIRSDYNKQAKRDEAIESITGERAASLRFFAQLRHLQGRGEERGVGPWELSVESLRLNRTEPFSGDRELLFALEAGESSPVLTPANGDLSFFVLEAKEDGADSGKVARIALALRALLVNEAEGVYMSQFFEKMRQIGD